MFSELSYQEIIKRMLDLIPDEFDKREGSIIFDALAPIAVELRQMYISLQHVLKATYAKESYGQYLDKRVAEMGIVRKKEKAASRKGIFLDLQNKPMTVPIGAVFFIDDIRFTVERELDKKEMLLTCSQKGSIGNHPHGDMLAGQSIPLLSRAQLKDIISPGEDMETDEALYARYISYVLEKPFAGNKAAYKQELSTMAGVGPVKVQRATAPNGMVSIFLLNSEYAIPSKQFLSDINDHFDPEKNPDTITPLFQKVLCLPPREYNMSVQIHMLPLDGIEEEEYTTVLTSLLRDIEKDYLEAWEKTDMLTIFISHIEAVLYQSNVVKDVKVYLNTRGENITMNHMFIPVFKEVTIHAL